MSSPSGCGYDNPFLEDQGAIPGPYNAPAGPLSSSAQEFVADFAKSYHASQSDAGQQQSAQFQGPAAVPIPYSPLTSVGKAFGVSPAVGLSPPFHYFVRKEVMPLLHLTHGSGSVDGRAQSQKWQEMALRSELFVKAVSEFEKAPDNFIMLYRSAMIYNSALNQLFIDIAKQDTRFHLDLTGFMFAKNPNTTFMITDSERGALRNAEFATLEQGRCILKAKFQPEGSPWKQQLLSAVDPNIPQFHWFDASIPEQQQPTDTFPATCDEFIDKLKVHYPEEYHPAFTRLTGQMQHLILMRINGDEGLDTEFFMQLYLLAVSRQDARQKDAWLGMAIEADKILQKFENDHLHEAYTDLLSYSPHLAPMAVPLQNWRVEQARIQGIVGSGSEDAPFEV